MVDIHTKSKLGHRHIQKDTHTCICEDREKRAIYKPRRKAAKEANPADRLS